VETYRSPPIAAALVAFAPMPAPRGCQAAPSQRPTWLRATPSACVNAPTATRPPANGVNASTAPSIPVTNLHAVPLNRAMFAGELSPVKLPPR
jgi:hypothetical protein